MIGSELDPKSASSLAAQAFVRRESPRLRAQTKQVVGEQVAKYVLFGVEPGKSRLNKKSSLLVDDVLSFNEQMDKAWLYLNEYIKDKKVIALNSTAIASHIIERLKADNPQPEATEPTPVKTKGYGRGRKRTVAPAQLVEKVEDGEHKF